VLLSPRAGARAARARRRRRRHLRRLARQHHRGGAIRSRTSRSSSAS